MFNPVLRGLAAAAFVASAALPAWAETVTDTMGRTVDVPDDPQRIVLGFYYEDYMAVAGPDGIDRLAGISRGPWEGWRNLQWKNYVSAMPKIADLPDVGDTGDGTFSLESVVASRPDLVLLASWQYKALGEIADRIEAAGIPVVVLDYNAQTVEKHVESTLLLGKILNREDRAEQLAGEYEDAVAAVLSRLSDIPAEDRPRIYVELGRKGKDVYDNSYSGTQWGAVIDQLGAENIANGQVENYGPLSAEYVLSQDPQVVLLAGSGWMGQDQAILMGPNVDETTTHERMRPYMDRPGWDELEAVKNGRVFAVYHGGNRTLYDYAFLQFLAQAIYPEIFADLDPQAALDRFFDTYMPVPMVGTYMTRLPVGQDG
ncbi:ABC transporter substrate-binding protein [Chachezhania sediminis]|uniref:ABC transporter substrate-binding protein n=1 Tax=Chachezhania sediminis TaxID=2599291 RepID=UPI00131D3E52|nr:ABC transporter substrate-binding protein [Chachezhania sediminis]